MHNYRAELAALTHGIDIGALGDTHGDGEDEFIDLHTPGTGTKEEPGVGSGPFGPGTTPGAVPAREENWNFETDPAEYTIASGDTFVGLAATYLGDGGRWAELWNYGHNRSLFPDPDVIMSTGPLQMMPEATSNMLNWLNKGKPGTLPGKTKTETTAEKAGRLWPWLLGGAAVGILVAAVAGGRRRSS